MYECMNCGGKVFPTQEDNNIGKCESCGFLMPLPTEKNERIINLFNKANRFRINKEFDKAIGVYETILEEDRKQPDAYFCELLCLYGIEYVEDPVSKEKIMTCHKVNRSNIFDDPYYKYALEYSSGSKKAHYEKEAQKLDIILRDIIDVSNKEEPYDVFISYKDSETGSSQRTIDSVKAQELYNNLTNMNLRVFYSRVSLENVAGKNYEPYIYGALNSSKVMIVVGSKKEYFEAEWVKNEWTRYLKIIQDDPFKLLIPVYFDMSPKDLPVEFGNRQAMDMKSVSFTPDIIHIIKKACDKEKKEEKIVTNGVDVSRYIQRAHDLLEDNDYSKALEMYTKALDEKPDCYQAYLGKILISKNTKSLEEFVDRIENNKGIFDPFIQQENYNETTKEKIKEFFINCLGSDYTRYIKYAPIAEATKFNHSIDQISLKYLEYYDQCRKNKADDIERERIKAKEEQEMEMLANEERIKAEELRKNLDLLDKKNKSFELKYFISYFLLVILIFLLVPPFKDIAKNYVTYSDNNLNFILSFYKVLLPFMIFGIILYIFLLKKRLNKRTDYRGGSTIEDYYKYGVLLLVRINSLIIVFSVLLSLFSVSDSIPFLLVIVVGVVLYLVYLLLHLILKILFKLLVKLILNGNKLFYIVSIVIMIPLILLACTTKIQKYYVYEGDLNTFMVRYKLDGIEKKISVYPTYISLIYTEDEKDSYYYLSEDELNNINNAIKELNIMNLPTGEVCLDRPYETFTFDNGDLKYDGNDTYKYICNETVVNQVNERLIKILESYIK